MALVRNTWIVFLLSGLWHGASWTFLIWGALHAFCQTLDLMKRRWIGVGELTFGCRVASILLVNVCITFAWIFFRANTFADLAVYLKVLFTGGFGTTLMALCAGQGPMVLAFSIIAVSLLVLSYACPRDCAFKTIQSSFAFTISCSVAIIFMGMPSGGEFIYFQF